MRHASLPIARFSVAVARTRMRTRAPRIGAPPRCLNGLARPTFYVLGFIALTF